MRDLALDVDGVAERGRNRGFEMVQQMCPRGWERSVHRGQLPMTHGHQLDLAEHLRPLVLGEALAEHGGKGAAQSTGDLAVRRPLL
jgi:hypothetical protein